MSEKLQPVRGTHDLLPEDFARQEYITQTAQRIASLYGYARMDTPIFEFSEVFHRAVGETSDIVSKETYTFTDRGGESLTLRPEFTAAIVRAFVSNGLQQNVPFKLHDDSLDGAFLKGAQARGLLQLKGHRSVGGMRASIYNAMPIDGVRALVDYMREFQRSHG